MAGIQKVALIGAGAMGGLYAQHFERGGFDVALVARGERAARLRHPGVTVNGEPLGARVLDADQPDAAWGPADLAILAVKDRHVPDALEQAAPFVGPDTIWLSVMNGLDSEAAIAERFGGGHVLTCVGFGMSAGREGAAVHYTTAGTLLLDRAATFEGTGVRNPVATHGPDDPDVRAVTQALDRAGLAAQVPEDIRHQLWWKFLVNVGGNQASAILGQDYGGLQTDADARAFMWALADEVIAVANAEGVNLGEQDKQAWDDVLARQTPTGRTSMHQDVEAGRPTEVEMLAGRVVALGERHGLATPHNQVALWVLRAPRARTGV